MSETLDSKVMFELFPGRMEDSTYRTWVEDKLIFEWLVGYENNPKAILRHLVLWNEDNPFFASVGGEWLSCKLIKWDGEYGRQITIRDHYSQPEVEKIQKIADSLETYLQQEDIRYERTNCRRRLFEESVARKL